jgi:N-acetylhexosamine 1-kinase
VDAEFAVPDAVLTAYGLDDAHIELLTGGRTNRTMRVRAGRDLVLQQMLGSAHNDLLGIMENLVRVTSHLEWRRRVERQGDSWYPHLVPTNHGKPFLMTAEGDVWRTFAYRKGQILRLSQPLSALASAAALYGRFAAETADLGGPPLIETAPAFHNIDLVYTNLLSDFEASSIDRRRDLEPILDHLGTVKKRLDDRCVDDGVQWAPDRVVHNDAKLSNVLFDRDHGRATAVLDLDLVMMGPSWHDVGDLIRSASWHAPTATESPAFSAALFDAVVGAFVEAAGDTLTDAEIVSYAAAGPRLSFELGLRYLNDHLRDEAHLRVRGENGHLLRGQANVKLAEEMLGAYDALRRIVDAFVAKR